MKKKDKYIVLSIAKQSLVHKYPAKYMRDTNQFPVFQSHLVDDDGVFIVHEDDLNNIVDEQDFIQADDFFIFGDVEKMTVEYNKSDETADVWLDKHYGNPVGTERDRRKSKSADGLMIPNSGQQKRLEGK